jgi:competence protein ComEA
VEIAFGRVTFMDGKRSKLAVGLLIALAVAGTGLYSWWQKSTMVTTAQIIGPVSSESMVKNDKVMVYISGGINRPGVYEVQSGLRVLDVVNLAGGVTPNADANRINMAQAVKDGLHVSVPVVMAGSQSENPSGSNNERISINKASKSELDKLPGIGPAMAERIIEYRQTNGAFKELDELKKVPGIGESKFKKLVNKITL